MHPIKHTHRGRLWCGLAALSALTGYDTETCRRAVQLYRGRPIKGISTRELACAATQLGYKLRRVHIAGDRPTLNQWRKANRELVDGPHPVILVVSNHYVVLHGRKFADSQEGNIWYGDTKRKRCRVTHYLVVEGTVDPMLPAPKPRPVDTSRKARTEAKALAATHGIKIEVYNAANVHGEIECWVYPPDALDNDERDAFASDHLAFGWTDVLNRCRKYAADLTNLNTAVNPATV